MEQTRVADHPHEEVVEEILQLKDSVRGREEEAGIFLGGQVARHPGDRAISSEVSVITSFFRCLTVPVPVKPDAQMPIGRHEL